MKKTLLCLPVVLCIVGCATVSNPVPPEYKGPEVQLADSGAPESGSKGQFFVVSAIDGVAIENALQATRAASYGKGFALTMRNITRYVPARPMKVKILATHQTAAPVQEIASRVAGTFFSVEGVVDFNPSQGHRYRVTGELKKEQSCVWIMDTESSEPVTEKICTK